MNSRRFLLLFQVLFLGAGCIHHQTTSYRDEARVPVTFENDDAGRVFYEALSRVPSRGASREGSTKLHIPVVFSYEETVRTGDSQRFNDAVRRCDTDQDGRVTVTEARIFAGSIH